MPYFFRFRLMGLLPLLAAACLGLTARAWSAPEGKNLAPPMLDKPGKSDQPSPPPHAAREANHPDARLQARRNPVVRVFEAARPSVVNIASTQIIEVRSPWDSLFQDLLDMPSRGPVRRYKQTSVGSGFVLHRDGYIVTNAHVVARTAERMVIFGDQKEYPAQIVALDQDRDLAILKIQADQPLIPLPLGRSDDLMPGETVVAIGNPLGYQHTVTTGIISALDRSVDVSEQVSFKGLIQTDASINPGNSGGPLLNVLGELIGVNTAIRGDAQNIGFAIPVDHLKAVLPDMLDVERRYRIQTGLELQDAIVGQQTCCQVRQVQANSPAQRGGVQAGDLVLTLRGQPVHSAIDYWIALLGSKAGQSVPLQVQRQGKIQNLTLVLAERPKPDGAKLLLDHLGLQADKLTPALAQSMGLRGLNGLIVTQAPEDGPAGAVGIKRGDVVMQIGRYPAVGLDEVGQLLERIKPGQEVQLTVLRAQGPRITRYLVSLKAR